MKRRLTIAYVFLVLMTTCVMGGEVIDRIVAVVNGKLILQSDIEQEARLEAFLAGQHVSEFKTPDLQTILQRMIDRQLIHEQMRGARPVEISSPPVERRVKDFRMSIGKSAQNDEEWQRILVEAGVTDQEVRRHFADEVQTMRFVESRLRPQIQVDSTSIENYYRQELLPQIQKSGGDPVPLQDVTRRIRDILVEKKLDASLSDWLKSLREQSDIRVLAPIEPDQSSSTPQAK